MFRLVRLSVFYGIPVRCDIYEAPAKNVPAMFRSSSSLRDGICQQPQKICTQRLMFGWETFPMLVKGAANRPRQVIRWVSCGFNQAFARQAEATQDPTNQQRSLNTKVRSQTSRKLATPALLSRERYIALTTCFSQHRSQSKKSVNH